MGKHSEWRKMVKKERRRRIRTQKAKEIESSVEYQQWCKEQAESELLEAEHIENCNKIENNKWVQAELETLEQWKQLQIKNELLHQEKLQRQAKLKLEREMEEQRREREIERLREIEEENRKRQETFMNNLEKFLNGDSMQPPKELLILYESKPDTEPCPFFAKTACCRFGDECSRNHKYPGISKILLAANMFGHFGLENANYNEYDTDIMLEYEDKDTYQEFKDYFLDILPEFQKFGKVVELKVCNNYVKHLRGNTYIEYADVRSAVQAYRALHSRWYGGKQLSLQFCQLLSWHYAICGLQSSNRCPRGRTCNFLHVFKNPLSLHGENRHSDRQRSTSSRSWRWSVSPERRSKSDRESERHSRRHSERNHYRHRSRRSSSSRKRD